MTTRKTDGVSEGKAKGFLSDEFLKNSVSNEVSADVADVPTGKNV